MTFSTGWRRSRPSTALRFGMIALLSIAPFMCDCLLPPTTNDIRNLEIGDFDRFNTLFQDAIIKLNDQEISTGELTLVVTNLQCTDIKLGDVQLDYSVAEDVNGTNASVLAVSVSASPFSMTCTADYTYDFTFLTGKGDFESLTVDNSVNSTINLIAPNGFDMEVPSLSGIAACSSEVNVEKTTFNGGIVGVVLNLFESAVSEVIANQANIAVCRILNELGGPFFTELLNSTKVSIDEWLEPVPENFTDPLYAERNYVPPEGVTLLSFSSDSNSTLDTDSIGQFVVNAIVKQESLLNGIVEDPQSPTGENLEINVFLRDNFLDENGTLSLTFDDWEIESGEFNPVVYNGEDKLSKTSIRINGIHVVGLDTLTTFVPLIEIGDYTFRNELRWDRLSIALDLSLTLQTSTLDDPILVSPTPVTIMENITISLDLERIDVNASIFLAIDQNKFDTLPLGSLLKNPVVCFLSALDTLEVSGLEVSLGKLSEPVITGFVSPGFEHLVATLVEAAFIAYEPTLLRAIPYFFQVPVRDIIKESFIDKFVGDENECLSNALEIPETSVIDFRDLFLPSQDAVAFGGSGTDPYGKLMHSVYDIVKDEFFSVDPTTGLAAVNKKFLADFGMRQSGTPGRLFFPGDLLNNERVIRRGGQETYLRVRVFDAYIENIDSIGVPLTLLEPVSNNAYLLENEGSIGMSRPLRVGLRFFLGISNSENSDIENDVHFFLDFTSLQILLTFLARVSEKAFMIFPLQDITKLQCWLATIPAPQLDEQGFRVEEDVLSLAVAEFIGSVSDLAMNVSCVKCSGSRVPELSNLIAGLKDSDDVTIFVNGIFNFTTKLINGDFLQIAADRAVDDSKYLCPHSATYDANFVRTNYTSSSASQDDSTVSFFVGIVIVSGAMLLLVLAAILVTKIVVRRRHGKWLESLPKSSLRILRRHQVLKNETNVTLDSSTVSMFRSDAIPLWIRIAMPVVIVGNIGFFLSGHLSLAANVSVMATLGGQTFEDNDLFEFSVAKSTIQIWQAGGRGLAMIIFLLSFAWPYTKQLLILGLWFASPMHVSVARRGSIFLWLDLLGKWSIIDIFVLVIVLVGFQLSIQSPDLEFLPSDFYSINLLVVPKWGLYSNMTAQILSQLSSHWIIHYHRRIVYTAVPHLDPSRSGEFSIGASQHEECIKLSSVQPGLSKIDNLFTHAFSRPHRGESDKLVPRRFVNLLLYFLSLSVLALVVLGCMVPAYSVNKIGVVGILIEAGQDFEDAYSEYSVFSTIKSIMDQARLTGNVSDYIGLGSLSALLIFSVMLVPILQVLVLLVQWFSPLTRTRRFRLSVVLEILQAWQYMEVFLLAILIGSWQLGSISAFLINPYCSALEDFFANLAYYGILQPEDAQCFQSNVGLEPTFYILFVAAVVLSLTTSFVVNAVKHYFRDIDPYQKAVLGIGRVKDVELASGNLNESLDTSTNGCDIQPVPVLFTDQYRWLLRRETAFEALCSEQTPTSTSVESRESVDVDIRTTTGTLYESESKPTEVAETYDQACTTDDGEDDDVCFVHSSQILDVSPDKIKGAAGNVVAVKSLGTGFGTSVLRRGYDVDDEDLIFESKSEVLPGSDPANVISSTGDDLEAAVATSNCVYIPLLNESPPAYDAEDKFIVLEGGNGNDALVISPDNCEHASIPSDASPVVDSLEVNSKDETSLIGPVTLVPIVPNFNVALVDEPALSSPRSVDALEVDSKSEASLIGSAAVTSPVTSFDTHASVDEPVFNTPTSATIELEPDSSVSQNEERSCSFRTMEVGEPEMSSPSNASVISARSPDVSATVSPQSRSPECQATLSPHTCQSENAQDSSPISENENALKTHVDRSNGAAQLDDESRYEDVNHDNVPLRGDDVDDFSMGATDNHSVGSDHTPRRTLQMN